MTFGLEGGVKEFKETLGGGDCSDELSHDRLEEVQGWLGIGIWATKDAPVSPYPAQVRSVLARIEKNDGVDIAGYYADRLSKAYDALMAGKKFEIKEHEIKDVESSRVDLTVWKLWCLSACGSFYLCFHFFL